MLFVVVFLFFCNNGIKIEKLNLFFIVKENEKFVIFYVMIKDE